VVFAIRDPKKIDFQNLLGGNHILNIEVFLVPTPRLLLKSLQIDVRLIDHVLRFYSI